MIVATAQAAASAPLGGHLWHLIAGIVPLVVAAIVVLVERARRPRQTRDEYLARPAARALLTADSFGMSARRTATSDALCPDPRSKGSALHI
jgi:hypothetical protein